MLLASRYLVFDDFRFNIPTRELLRVGVHGSATPISLGSRAADLLQLFLDRRGELITKNEIMDAVWPNMAVEESNLTVQISALRRALGPSGNGTSYIQTVPGRGYRFTPRVYDANGSDMIVLAGAAGLLEADAAEPLPQKLQASPESVPAPSLRQSVSAVSSEAPAGGRPAVRWRLAAAGIVAAAVVIVHWRGFSSELPMSRAAQPRLSIVALPFVNASGEPKDDELAAAMTDDVTTGLAQTPGSYVIALSMAQAMAARKLLSPAIGAELGVRYVLEGNIRRSRDAVELKIRLSDTASGAIVWTRQFGGSASDPSDLRFQIVENLLFPLRTEFLDAEARRLSNLPAAELTADDLLLQVRASNNHPFTPAKNAANVARLEHALMLEPASAEIMIALALENVLPILQFEEREDRDKRLLRANALAERARTVAAGSESLLALQAQILRAEGRLDDAIAAFTALLQADPKAVHYRTNIALCLLQMGRSPKAIPLLEDAIRLDRSEAAQFAIYSALGQAYVRIGRNDEGINWLRAAQQWSSGFSPIVNRWLAIAYGHAGKLQDARRELGEYAKQRPALTLRGLLHSSPVNPAPAEETWREIEGLAVAGLRDHVDEDADPGLPIDAGLRSIDLSAPTPLGAPGVSTIRTSELSALLRGKESGASQDAPPLLLWADCSDCLDIAFPGAIHVPEALRREPMDDERRRALKTWLNRMLGGNPTRRLIATSWNAERWHARNLAIELVALSYPNVSWYRGGLEAWDVAGLPAASNEKSGTRAIFGRH
jgi:DNA-binding winged helix-turn-helix (wHTH) protein/TolB-like protein